MYNLSTGEFRVWTKQSVWRVWLQIPIGSTDFILENHILEFRFRSLDVLIQIIGRINSSLFAVKFETVEVFCNKSN